MDTYQAELRAGLRQRYQDKKILILGLGREGQSTYHFLRQILPDQDLYLMDEREISLQAPIYQLENRQTDPHITCLWGRDYLQDLDQYDLVFKTPGLAAHHLQGLDRGKITSQTNEFVRQIGSRVVAITGTKGKSTTSCLVYECLKDLGQEVDLVGNIGRPALELLLEDRPGRLYVYEMSSHQSQFLGHAPRVGVVLNLFEEHLDNYLDYEDYIQAKLNIGRSIYTGQDGGRSLFLYGCDNQRLKTYADRWQNCRHQSFGHLANNSWQDGGVFLKNRQILYYPDDQGLGPGGPVVLGSQDFPRKLLGDHNLVNSLVAFLVVQDLLGLDQEKIQRMFQVIANFPGLEHRLEKVGDFRGISFYNDSISTIPAAAMEAIYSIKQLQTLIIGGYDRGIDYQGFITDLNQYPDLRLICLPATGHKIFAGLNHRHKYRVEDMAEAVDMAYALTQPGHACVLSPAAASYTFYKNFEDRGADYKAKVRALGRQENLP